MAGSWFQRPQTHSWTWYSNAGGVAKEIDHVLIDGQWRMIQNCRIYWSAQFLNNDHRLVVATLKLQLKSRRMGPSQPRLGVGRPKDERVVEEFANRLSGDLGGLGAVGNPEELILQDHHPSCCRRMSWNSLSGEEELCLPGDTEYH